MEEGEQFEPRVAATADFYERARLSYIVSFIAILILQEPIRQENRNKRGKGWRAATRSEYRKVEELTLAGFFVITLLASTISESRCYIILERTVARSILDHQRYNFHTAIRDNRSRLLYRAVTRLDVCAISREVERRKILSSPAGRASEMNFITQLGSPLENVRCCAREKTSIPLSSLPSPCPVAVLSS
ncbi:hypothetical protein DBV15_12229 [Temnothorax longispinosus]|uniref:Uncharacterized protein n=1 Tax=Temnothorax longispinosus TaxID=300112 RepID=A0A4S2KGV9_9HYME|nr:hypothetical protein DBV15_12229 [Temnothorax longispinosus]